MSTSSLSRYLNIGMLIIGLLCGVALLPRAASAGAASADDLRALVARDGWVLVRVELASAPSSGDSRASAIEAPALVDAVDDLLFGLPERSYADVERLSDGSSLVMKVDSAGLDGLLASDAVEWVAPAAMPAVMYRASGGRFHSLAVKADDTLWVWGSNEFGQLGDGTTTDRIRPRAILSGVRAVAAGDSHTLALKTDGSLWAWGYNGSGALGDGTSGFGNYRTSPISVMSRIVAIAAGGYHTVALRLDGTLWAWGDNWNGQIGDGTTTMRPKPRYVMKRVASFAGGYSHTLAVRTDGTLWAWGDNWDGQLGDGTTTDRLRPTFVMDRVSAVAGGFRHTLALKTDGSLWAWGYNGYGQLGDGTATNRLTPVYVMSGVKAIAAGGDHSFALKTDDSLWAWGSNYFGQLGDGTTMNHFAPTRVITGVSAMAVGHRHSQAWKTDGSLWAFGYNWYGQLGDGTTITRLTPVQVIGFGALTKPAAPTEIKAQAQGVLQIYLTWRDNSSNEAGFQIQRKVGLASWQNLGDVPADTTSIAYLGLSPNTNYRYRVRAFNAAGVSAWATSTVVKTPQ